MLCYVQQNQALDEEVSTNMITLSRNVGTWTHLNKKLQNEGQGKNVTTILSVFAHIPNQSINLNISFRPSYITFILRQLFFINQHDIMEEYFIFLAPTGAQ